MLKRIAGWAGSLAVSALVFLILLEGGLYIAVKAGWLDVELPGYAVEDVNWFWKVTNADVGVWHEPNDRMRHERSCFDVTYTSNAFGMRDATVEKEGAANRVVVLGDSFVEGWGVSDADRFTEVLERKTGIEHLNFGTSGGFGTTQSYILYKTLAAGFTHGAVIFAILPDNDFADDTPSESDLAPDGRWRPFLVGTYPDYVLTYPARNFSPDRQAHRSIPVLLNEFWLTARVFNYYKAYFREMARLKAQQGEGADKGASSFSGYFDYDEKQFDRLRYAIEKIQELAGTRRLLVVTIPRPTDYRRAEKERVEPPIRRDLNALAKESGFTYIDLMTEMPDDENLKRFFHDCDGHWSPEGHARVADIIAGWDYYASFPKK
jgi:lysophospholipase L1-like esterase